jgi:tRNA A37 threonylcarbamoyladenosine synthetase subunit TsaC/SUA5/YrdC
MGGCVSLKKGRKNKHDVENDENLIIINEPLKNVDSHLNEEFDLQPIKNVDNHLKEEFDLQTIAIEEEGAFEIMINALKENCIVIQLPGTFALIAEPTLKGVEQLNRTKDRVPGKYYSTLNGDIKNFVSCIQKPDALPTEFLDEDGRFLDELFCGSIIRVQFTDDTSLNTDVIQEGSHQTFLFQGIHREFFIEAEKAFSNVRNEHLFGANENNQPYTSIIASSANISGDPLGMITDYERAVEFCKSRGVKLLVTTQQESQEKGSMTIFILSQNEVRVARKGQNLKNILNRIPEKFLQEETLALKYE